MPSWLMRVDAQGIRNCAVIFQRFQVCIMNPAELSDTIVIFTVITCLFTFNMTRPGPGPRLDQSMSAQLETTDPVHIVLRHQCAICKLYMYTSVAHVCKNRRLRACCFCRSVYGSVFGIPNISCASYYVTRLCCQVSARCAYELCLDRSVHM
jgi:hypothetical protein